MPLDRVNQFGDTRVIHPITFYMHTNLRPDYRLVDMRIRST